MEGTRRLWGTPPAWTVTQVMPDDDPGAPPVARDADEATLVAACLAGRRDAFDVIVERHRRAVYQICYRFTHSHEDASDLAQDVFVRAYRGLQSFRGQSSLSTWLYRIAVNTCLTRVGVKRPVHEELDDAMHTDTSQEPPDAGIWRGQLKRRVQSAIRRLPDRQRATVILRVYHEMTHEQIARVFGTSVGAVKANFFHALRNLERLLGPEGEP